LAETYAFWIRRKYNLSPADPRFLALTPFEVETEFYAHWYCDNHGQEEYEDDDLDIDALMNDPNEWQQVVDFNK
jgi:hypothetical protein